MTMRAQIVTEAREWIGTRYRHQQRVKGVGTDCVGFVYGVGFALGLFPAVDKWVELEKFAGYGIHAHDNILVDACTLMFEPIKAQDAAAGDVVLMRFEVEPHHLAILSDYPLGGFALIHAYSQARKVIEHRFDDLWHSRVVSYWRMKGISE